MKELSSANMTAYLNEYERHIMRKLKCRITWGIISDTASAAENHFIVTSENSPISCILTESKVTDKEAYKLLDALSNQDYPKDGRIATLETDFWKMDGKFRLPEKASDGTVSNCGDNGWVSDNLCDENGDFAVGNRPSLIIKFECSQPINIVGLHFVFFAYCGEYPTNFDVKVTTTDNAVYTISDIAADNYIFDLDFSRSEIKDSAGADASALFGSGFVNIKEITVTIKKWCKGNRRARIDEIEFGQDRVYDSNMLIDAEETRVINAVSTELPISNFTFTVLDKEMLFDSENPANLIQFLTMRQPIEVEWIQETEGEDVVVKSGTYYLKEWNDTDSRREYKITAEDLIGFMDEPYNKGTLTLDGNGKIQAQKVKTLVKNLFDDLFPPSSGLNDKLDCDAIGDDVEIIAPLPLKLNNQQCTYKDCFMMLAQVAGCVITTDNAGKVVFKKLSRNYVSGGTDTPLQYKIPTSVVFDNPPRSNLKSALKQVQVNYYSYKWDGDITNQLYSGKTVFSTGEKYNFEMPNGGLVNKITIGSHVINVAGKSFITEQGFTIHCYSFMVEVIYNGTDESIVSNEEISVQIEGQKLIASSSVYNSAVKETNGEVVTIDVPICSSYARAQTIANNFIAEAEERDEFELEIKRNILWECGDILELEKPMFGSDNTNTHLPCRLLENKKSLTKVRQSVKLRKLKFN